MSKYRKSMSSGKSQSQFTAGGVNIHSKNTNSRPMRGGIRL